MSKLSGYKDRTAAVRKDQRSSGSVQTTESGDPVVLVPLLQDASLLSSCGDLRQEMCPGLTLGIVGSKTELCSSSIQKTLNRPLCEETGAS